MEQNVQRRARIEIRMPQARAPLIQKAAGPERYEGCGPDLRHLTRGPLYGESKEIDLQGTSLALDLEKYCKEARQIL